MSYIENSYLDNVEDYLEDNTWYDDEGVEEWDDDDEGVEEWGDDDEGVEEWDDDGEGVEEWDDDDESAEALTERRRFRSRYLRSRYRSPWRRSFYKRFRRGIPRIRGVRRGGLRTPAGNASIRFPKAVATQASVSKSLKILKHEINTNNSMIKKLDKRLIKNTSILDKKVNALTKSVRIENKKLKADVKKQMGTFQQMMMLPMLMSSTPKIKSVKGKFSKGDSETVVDVTDTIYEKDDISMMLPLMMSGMGGSEDGSNNMMMMFLMMEAMKD